MLPGRPTASRWRPAVGGHGAATEGARCALVGRGSIGSRTALNWTAVGLLLAPATLAGCLIRSREGSVGARLARRQPLARRCSLAGGIARWLARGIARWLAGGIA